MSTNAAPLNILQNMQTGGMLVEVNGLLLMIVISTLSNLAEIERDTAEHLDRVSAAFVGCTRVLATFRQQVLHICTDGCAANILCEKHDAVARGDAWSAVHVLFDVQRTSLVHGKTLRGMLRCALSLRNGAVWALSERRDCLEVADRTWATACRGRGVKESSS